MSIFNHAISALGIGLDFIVLGSFNHPIFRRDKLHTGKEEIIWVYKNHFYFLIYIACIIIHFKTNLNLTKN